VVLSCAHLFRGGAGRVQVRLPDGRTLDARPAAIDAAWDLSALEIDSVGAKPIAIATAAPEPGQRLQSCGFGSDGRYRCHQGRARGYTQSPKTSTSETLCLSGSARDGDSGGPVLNERGELVGVLWGTDGQTVRATYCGRIRKFLACLLPNLGAPPPPSMEQLPRPESPKTAPPGSQPLDRLDAIARQLEQATERQKQRDDELTSRLGRLEGVIDTIGAIRARLDRAEQATAPERTASRVREAIGPVAATGASSLIGTALPGLLMALGWTAPPSLAAILALRIGLAILRRRAKKRRAGEEIEHDSTDPRPWNDQYASQLNEVYALSGRSSTADATLGREYDRELREMESGADDATSRWAHNLRRRVADRFLRIHDQSPSPAEPLKDSGFGVQGSG
jgi:hypothetical protein